MLPRKSEPDTGRNEEGTDHMKLDQEAKTSVYR